MRNQTASEEQDDVARLQYALNGKIMLCSVVVLVAAVFVIFGFHTCLLRRRHSRRRRIRRHRHLFQSPDLPAAAAAAPVGLDLSVLKSLPSFAYSSAVHDPLLECAVCLSEFENDETGRVLPKCNHTFHVDCIDMWFRSHSNCPLCRAPVQTGIPVPDSIQISVQAIFLVHEQTGSEAQLGSESELFRKHAAEAGSSSTSVWVAVEEPEETGPGSGSPGMGDRIISLKRV